MLCVHFRNWSGAVSLADLGGVRRVQILLFRHTKFSKRNHHRSRRPPPRGRRPPTRNPGSATVFVTTFSIFYQLESVMIHLGPFAIFCQGDTLFNSI